MDKVRFFELWGSMAALAGALGKSETTVRAWFARGSIPGRYDAAIIEVSRARDASFGPAEMHMLRQDVMQASEAAA